MSLFNCEHSIFILILSKLIIKMTTITDKVTKCLNDLNKFKDVDGKYLL